jgi:signal transduction histidine kinase
MKVSRAKSGSLLWRILLSTSLVISVVFALTGWLIEKYAASVSRRSIEEEVQTSLQAYESLWAARVHNLGSLSRVISSMSDVRAAFMTHDRATIRDTAQELWSQVSEQDASFLVLDPTGDVIASLGGDADIALSKSLMEASLKRFPNQVSGYLRRGKHLYYIVLTPVYVQTAHDQALLNVLLVAFDIDNELAQALRHSTHGSDFAFVSYNDVIASTLPSMTAANLMSGRELQGHIRSARLEGADYLLLGTDLNDPLGTPVGRLYIIRSFAAAEAVVTELKRTVAIFWGLAILIAIGFMYLLARRVLDPVKRLDRAAEEVIRHNYDYRVPVETDDELGRLARTFNEMCESIRSAREELIRQEQIATIGRLSSSIVHDLRNPLAAIYGGAEMLIDADLSPEQSRRLVSSIYTASRRIQELLQDLLDISRAKTKPAELCKISELIAGARDTVANAAAAQSVAIQIDVPEDIQILVDRDRIQRVFLNLMNNALDVMPDRGSLRISGRTEQGTAIIEVQDSGPGIPAHAWPRLFQPFASFGKKNGLGLGLALSRQTLLDHGGDLWAEKTDGAGAKFVMRLPTAMPIGTEPRPGVQGTSASAR